MSATVGRYADRVNTEPASAPVPDSPESRAAVGFVLELARAMHQYGTPAHRLETALAAVATRLGLAAEFFSTPTSIMVGFGDMIDQRVHLIRVEPGETNLGNIARLGDIVNAVTDDEISVGEGLRRIHEVKDHARRWSKRLLFLAFVLASTSVAVFLRVNAGELFVAAFLGLVTASIVLYSSSVASLRPVTEPLTAFVVTTLAFAMDAVMRSGNGYLTTLAGLVVLLPGLTFTVALTELSTRHLASGTARLSGAMVVFLGLGFGVALGAKLGGVFGVDVRDIFANVDLTWFSAMPLPWWTEWLALLIAPLAFTVLLNAGHRDALWIVGACCLAYLTSRIAGASMGEELGAFLGAFAVSAGSNLVARYLGRSPMITQVPGLLILVPGSIGFRSVTSFFGQQVEAGVETGFRLAVIGISLAAGILAGNIIGGTATPRRRHRRAPLPSVTDVNP